MASKDEAQGQGKASGIKGKLQGLGNYMYNKRDGTVLDRSCTSWGWIGLFYLVFYACLALFWTAMLYGFFTTIKDKEPKLQNWESLIKYNPGMGYRPQPEIEYTLIKFNQGVFSSYEDYTDHLNEFLDKYDDNKQLENGLIDCDPDDPYQDHLDPSLACKFPLKNLGSECTKEKHYGYDEGRPCVLLKMNKLFNWMPEPYTNETAQEDVPYNSRYATVTCEGVTDADRDNVGPIKFFPEGGFDIKYFPYRNQKNYLQPLVMVQFERLRAGTLIQVWCKVWAENIYHDRNDRAGSVGFEILMD